MPTAYDLALEQYAAFGVDVSAALATLKTIPISLHCWQGDDVVGFESSGASLGGGLAVTGNYPGRARTADELRQDLDLAYSLIPGTHRLNLHALYAEFSATGPAKKVDRDELTPAHFQNWLDWARAKNHGLDFNPSYFAHPKAASGFTLASADKSTRDFWIRHGQACRRIGAHFGKELSNPCVTNVWIPDGYKDTPADRFAPRARLKSALDELFSENINPAHNLDAVEGKLFGIGTESYTVGSHEFYLGYAITHHKLPCLDAGHYHPTETISDKLSSVLAWCPELLLHVSRGVRWDSDHVVTLTDDLVAIAEAILHAQSLGHKIHLGLDFFDASINRTAAWIIGTRSMLKALLLAALTPPKLKHLEAEGDHTSRLALQEEAKTLPFAPVWNAYCEQQNVPTGAAWLDKVKAYESAVLSKRK